MIVDAGDGLLVNDETGEILDFPSGEDRLAYAAAKLADAHAQRMEWQRIENALKAVFVTEQGHGRRVYNGDTLVTVRDHPIRHFDCASWRIAFALDEDVAMFAPEQLRALLLAVKDIDASQAGPMAWFAARYEHETRSREYALVEKVRRAAPGQQERGVHGRTTFRG